MWETILQQIGGFALGYWGISFILWLKDEVDRKHAAANQPEPTPPAVPVEPITDAEFSAVHAWAQLNPWYAADSTLNMEAQIIHMQLQSREPHLTLEANLAHVTAEMHRRHPEIVPTRQ